MSLDPSEHDDLFFHLALPDALIENSQIDPHDLINGNFYEFTEAIQDILNDFDMDSDNPSSDVPSSTPSGVSTPLESDNSIINPVVLPSAASFNTHDPPLPENPPEPNSNIPEIVVHHTNIDDHELSLSDVSSSTSNMTPSRLDISSIPSNIDEIQQKIFAPNGILTFSAAEFESNWKFCNNMWTPSTDPYYSKTGIIHRKIMDMSCMKYFIIINMFLMIMMIIIISQDELLYEYKPEK
ncbi:hypothetical protein F4861DRAFT_544379 [Xylaria intraflava]|nr:hypothetical protein F4861DRAFT_544379 [Xylaria intraflava]